MATPEEMLESMIKNMPEKTGKPLEDWISLVRKSGLEKHGEIMKLLKGEHGMTHGYANLVSSKARETGEEVDLVTAQYSGGKAPLRPLFETLLAFAKTLGDDMEVAPKKASVSLRRKKQFALITPATKTRIDLGLALKGEEATGRLETYNAMCSHRVRLETERDFDAQVQDFIRLAYDRAG